MANQTSTARVSAAVPKLRHAPSGGPATGLLIAPVRTGVPRPGSASGRLGRVYSRADQPPRLRQLMGVCGWAAVLGGVGLVLGLRAFFGILSGAAPGWYEPATAAAGLVGISLTVGSFLTVQRMRAPWFLLSAASVTLVTAMVLTAIAL
jgi:hypothetical protein